MTDMVRGRINIDDPAEVEKLVRALQRQKEVSVVSVEPPKSRMGIEGAYPRHHVDVVDPVSGIKHEWQIGTRQTTRLYEEPGIQVGKVKIEPKNRNIHDVEYDVFKAIDDPSKTLPASEQAALRELSEQAGIPAFRKKVAELAARLGKENLPPNDLEKTLKALHEEATAILKKVVDLKGGDPEGVEFVNQFIH